MSIQITDILLVGLFLEVSPVTHRCPISSSHMNRNSDLINKPGRFSGPMKFRFTFYF